MKINYSIILLFAGRSSRFGSDKALADIHGIPLLRYQLEKISQLSGLISQSIQKIVVLGDHNQTNIESSCDLSDCTVVQGDPNPTSMLGSLQNAFKASRASTADLWMPGDCALISVDLMQNLIAHFEKTPTLTMLRPVSTTCKRGHPVLWNSKHRDSILQAKTQDSAKDLIQRLPSTTKSEMLWPADDFLLDMDTPDDYEKIKKILREK